MHRKKQLEDFTALEVEYNTIKEDYESYLYVHTRTSASFNISCGEQLMAFAKSAIFCKNKLLNLSRSSIYSSKCKEYAGDNQ
jgi:hypothetical protein